MYRFLPLIFFLLAALAAGDELPKGGSNGVYSACANVSVQKSSKNGKFWATAVCPTRDGGQMESHLDLDRCFTINRNSSVIKPEKEGDGFSAYCLACSNYPRLASGQLGPSTRCLCRDFAFWKQVPSDLVTSTGLYPLSVPLDLNGTVHNDDGVLSCFGLKGDHGPPPKPQDIPTTKEPKGGKTNGTSTDDISSTEVVLLDTCVAPELVHANTDDGAPTGLNARCYGYDGRDASSYLNLDHCFSWDIDHIQPEQEGIGYGAQCADCDLHGDVMTCVCGSYNATVNFNLKGTVHINDDGYLTCFSRKGDKHLPPAPMDAPSAKSLKGGFYDDCNLMTVEHPQGESARLIAACYTKQGFVMTSTLQLNRCLAFSEDDGLRPKIGGNAFTEHCQNATLNIQGVHDKETPAMMGCYYGENRRLYTVNLNQVVYNDEGLLSCLGQQGEPIYFPWPW